MSISHLKPMQDFDHGTKDRVAAAISGWMDRLIYSFSLQNNTEF